MIKNKVFIIVCLVLIIFGLFACQGDELLDESAESQVSSDEMAPDSESDSNANKNPEESTEVETGYPILDITPTKSVSQSEIESAYPVTQQDLELLIHTWSLTTLFVDEESQTFSQKLLKFTADGSYEMTTDEGSQTGQWRTRLMASESTLILEPDEGIKTTYEIIDLTAAVLNLRLIQDNMQIDEQYLPAD